MIMLIHYISVYLHQTDELRLLICQFYTVGAKGAEHKVAGKLNQTLPGRKTDTQTHYSFMKTDYDSSQNTTVVYDRNLVYDKNYDSSLKLTTTN